MIITKCQNCLLTQTFRVYNPSSVWKITAEIRNILVKGKCIHVKRSARTVQTHLTLMLRLSILILELNTSIESRDLFFPQEYKYCLATT